MTETTATCGRCGHTIEDTPIGVSVDGGPLHPTDPVLSICAASLSRWLERGRRRAASPRPMVQEPMDADDQRPASETSIPRRPAAASTEEGTPTQHRPAHPPSCGQRPRRDAGDQVRELASGIGMGGHESEDRALPCASAVYA